MKLFPLILFLVIFVGCNKVTPKTEKLPHSSETKEQSGIPTNPLKNAYFGETHMHTQYSLDAYIGGNRFTPNQSLRFAKGEAIQLEKFGKTWQLKRPLDFAAVTDHAEYIGESYTIVTPGAKGHDMRPPNPLEM